ncbi:MAG: hypothetical protein ACP5E5_00430 [Acidobacteriaceae bacterium]
MAKGNVRERSPDCQEMLIPLANAPGEGRPILAEAIAVIAGLEKDLHAGADHAI